MDSRPRKLEPVKEERWHIVHRSWRTAYQSVSWAHDTAENNRGSGWFRGPLFGTLRTSCDSPQPHQPGDDLVLSTDLCGVQCALDALVKYERDVGFVTEAPVSKAKGDISVEVDELVIAQAREKYELYAEALTSGAEGTIPGPALEEQLVRVVEVSRTSTPASIHGLHRSTSTLSSLDLTDSDMSLGSSSPPLTPTRKCTEAIVEVKDSSPVKADDGRFIVSSARPLNAAATSFVPSSATLKAETEPCSLATRKAVNPSALTNVASPIQKAPLLHTVQMKKDEEGFYSESEVAAPVPQSKKEGCTFLPPFLQSPSRRKGPASKTRAIVDRLRSSHNHSHSPVPNPPLYDLHLFDERTSVSEDDRTQNSGISSPSSHEDDDDGWINISEAERTSKESKARRTRDLFLALTRRRSDSLPPSQTDTAAKNEHADIEIPITTSPSSSSSPLPSQDDGWIDPSPAPPPPPPQAPPQRRAESRPRSTHRRRRSSHVPPAPVPPTTIPAPFLPLPIARAPVGLPQARASFPTPALPNYASPNPASFFYSAYPTIMSPVAYTSYMQQLQLMQQMQLRGGVGGGGGAGGARRVTVPASNEWFQYPTAGVPFPTPAARRELLW
ncbi:hypothetical protein C0992_010999 [Termitomyces sp. T32_za158]|nr:hypothetical protein C0992_010999 [Termitomyces sp. T32_za158]